MEIIVKMVEWTKGHFEEVAKIIKERSKKQIEISERAKVATLPAFNMNLELCSDFADTFKERNPRFSEERFMNACISK